MSNITPENISKLETRLGGKVLEYFTSGGDESTVSFVNKQGVETVGVVKKMDLTPQFLLSMPTVKLEKGATYAQAIAAFSQQFGLGLIRNVDYKATDDAIVFNGNLLGQATLTILNNSYLYKGSVTIRVVTEAGGKLIDSMQSLGKTFQLIFFQGILSASKPFQGKGKAFNGNQLSPELVDAVKARLSTSPYVTKDNINILRNATVFKYQTYRKEGEEGVVRVYLRDANRNLLSLAVVPQDSDDRPF
jgi:hypothetical protein